jgi:hypothetical protein
MLKIIAEGKFSHQTYREGDKFQLSCAGGLAIIYLGLAQFGEKCSEKRGAERAQPALHPFFRSVSLQLRHYVIQE